MRTVYAELNDKREELETLNRFLEEKEAELDDAKSDLNGFEKDNDEKEEQYCEMLNEGGTVSAGGCEFDPADVLRQLDPTAYRCGLNDYVDGLELSEFEGYTELEEKVEELESDVSTYESDIETLEEEIEELETELKDLTEGE